MTRRRAKERPPAGLSAIQAPVLVAAPVEPGGWVAIARDEIALVTGADVVWRRPWHEVERGEWDGEGHTLTVHWVGYEAPAVLTTRDQFPRDLPLAFRERVDASMVHSESVPARGGGTLRAVVRRTPDGDLLTQVLAVGRVQRGPELEAQMDELEARVRDAVGL